MGGADAGDEILFSKYNVAGEICSQQGQVLFVAQSYAHRQHGRKTYDIVTPEHALDLGKVCFVEVGAVAGRLQIDASNLDVQRVFLGSNDQVGAVGAQLATDLVADIGGDSDHRGGDAYAQHDGHPSKEFAPLLPTEGFVE